MFTVKPELIINLPPSRFRFTIFRIYPSDEVPSLQQIAQVEASYPSQTRLSFCSLSGNRVIYLLGSTLNVWDYAEDAWASIQVPTDYQQVRLPIDVVEILLSHIAQIIVSESTILVPYPDVVLIWKMPTLSKSKPLFSGSPPSNIPPAFTLKVPSNQTVYDCRGPCDWYSGSSQPLLFDFSYGAEFQRFEVVHKNEDFNDSAVKTLGRYRESSDNTVESSRFCNDSLVGWWIGKGDPMAHVASLPYATQSHPSNSIDSDIRLFKWLDKCRPMFYPSSLCPFSGRFACSYFWDRVRVVDYFSESLPVVRSSTHS